MRKKVIIKVFYDKIFYHNICMHMNIML